MKEFILDATILIGCFLTFTNIDKIIFAIQDIWKWVAIKP